MKTAVVIGVRPEIIKMTPIIRELVRRKQDYFILHTGQHYSYNIDKIFLEQLELPPVRYNLDVGSGSAAEQTARILTGVENTLIEEKPDVVLVEGDTNSTMASALAAAKLHMKVGHVEAGLRSYDRNMPEEINRILTDHCSDYLFAPTEAARGILRSEGIDEAKIFVTGNTIVDAVYQSLDMAKNKVDIAGAFGLKPKEYFLVTVHRQENVDNVSRFSSIIEGINRLSGEFDLPVIYPIHPRSRKMLAAFQLKATGIRMIDPVGFFEFLQLENNARLVLTDSGGVQEESCILGVPCVTLRDNTERPETIEAGSNMLAGTDPEMIVKHAGIMLGRKNDWTNPFGDGDAARRIIDITGGKHG